MTWSPETKELKYLEKIKNDIAEKLYDLLVLHIADAEERVEQHKEQLVQLLDQAVLELQKKPTSYNELTYFRYTILCCNKILRFSPGRKDIKDLKKKIIESFTHCSEDRGEKIPLNYQINEVRITFDTAYLKYLVRKNIDADPNNALYCLLAARLIEPDNEELETLHDELHRKIGTNRLDGEPLRDPKGKILAMDSQVVISRIFYDVGNFMIPHAKPFDIEKLGNTNKFIITPVIKKEVEQHMRFELSMAKMLCERNRSLDFFMVKETLEKRFSKLLEKHYHPDVKIDPYFLEAIKGFYLENLYELEQIVLDKIKRQKFSYKLRKLAQRESLLPEKGDLTLLAEVYSLKQQMPNIAILSEDKDLTRFSQVLREQWGIEVYGK